MNKRKYSSIDEEWKGLISLSCHNSMKDEDIEYAIYSIKEYFSNSKYDF